MVTVMGHSAVCVWMDGREISAPTVYLLKTAVSEELKFAVCDINCMCVQPSLEGIARVLEIVHAEMALLETTVILVSLFQAYTVHTVEITHTSHLTYSTHKYNGSPSKHIRHNSNRHPSPSNSHQSRISRNVFLFNKTSRQSNDCSSSPDCRWSGTRVSIDHQVECLPHHDCSSWCWGTPAIIDATTLHLFTTGGGKKK